MLTIRDVVQVLLDNRIDPAWIDHCYSYGYLMLSFLDRKGEMSITSLALIDNERLRHIHAHGTPPLMPEWSGWREPTQWDIFFVRHQFHTSLVNGETDPRESPWWFRVSHLQHKN
jgi:hypothetical protein